MEQIKRILIATDGSNHSKPAVDQGLHLAKLLGAKVTALYVVDQIPLENVPADTSAIYSVHALLETEGKRAVNEVRDAGKAIGIDVETIVTEGAPAKRIIEIAANYDLVVIGTLGRSGLSKLLMGSVAEKVARFAPCPVLIVRARRGAEQ